MQVSHAAMLTNGRRHHTIGRIKAVGPWRGAAAFAEGDREATVRALMEEAEGCDADAILDLHFDMDNVRSADLDAVSLKRLTATGVAVKFDEAA